MSEFNIPDGDALRSGDLHRLLTTNPELGASSYGRLEDPETFRNAARRPSQQAAQAQGAAPARQERPAARLHSFQGLPAGVPYITVPARSTNYTLADVQLVPPNHPDANRPAHLAVDHVQVPFMARPDADALRRQQAARPQATVERPASRPANPRATDHLHAAPAPDLTPEETAWLQREQTQPQAASRPADGLDITDAQRDLLQTADALQLTPEQFDRLWAEYGHAAPADPGPSTPRFASNNPFRDFI